MKRWEHKTVVGHMAKQELNELGMDGWELAGVRTTSQGHPVFYFKRELV